MTIIDIVIGCLLQTNAVGCMTLPCRVSCIGVPYYPLTLLDNGVIYWTGLRQLVALTIALAYCRYRGLPSPAVATLSPS